MRVVIVTGTGTGVGKTIATAALAVAAATSGSAVGAVKLVQTGLLPGEPGDASEVARLSGCPSYELVRLADPLAPATAARIRGVELPSVTDLVSKVLALADDHDVLLVEGAGGLLVRLDSVGGTVADVALGLRAAGCEVSVAIVATAELGTLNATALTVEALRTRGLEPAGLLLGSWPAEPGLVHRCNLEDLPALTGVPLSGVLPAGAGALSPADFRSAARSWIEAPFVAVPGSAVESQR